MGLMEYGVNGVWVNDVWGLMEYGLMMYGVNGVWG